MLKATFENLAHGELHIIDGVEVFIFTGKEPGPTTGFIAGQHGNELAGPLWLLGLGSRFVDDCGKITKGKLIVIRCANPEGMMRGYRWVFPLDYAQTFTTLGQQGIVGAERDRKVRLRHDMNRRWKVRGGVEEKLWGLFEQCTQVIDLHVADGGPMWQSTVCHGLIGENLADRFLSQTGLDKSGWSKLSGPEILPEGSLLSRCENAGIPSIGLELPMNCSANTPIPELAQKLHPDGFSEYPWGGERRRDLSLPEQQLSMPGIWQWILNNHK